MCAACVGERNCLSPSRAARRLGLGKIAILPHDHDLAPPGIRPRLAGRAISSAPPVPATGRLRGAARAMPASRLVTEGSFQYRTAQGDAVLAPGAVLLGNEGACFECGHEHAAGDRCLAFQFAPEHLEEIVAAVPGARRAALRAAAAAAAARRWCRSSPRPRRRARRARAASSRSSPCALPARSRRRSRTAAAAGAARPRATSGASRRRCAGSRRRRTRPLPLAALAREAGMSPYHFLRTVPGARRHDAAPVRAAHPPQSRGVRLRRTDDPSPRSPSTPASTISRPSTAASAA